MIDQIIRSFRAHRPPLLWGPPGVGKTALAAHVARRLGARSFVVYLSHKADNEVHGQPVIARKRMKFAGRECTVVEQAPPRYAIEALQAESAVIVYDELTTIPPAAAGPALAIFGEQMIGEHHLPRERVAIMACANPSSQAAGGWDLAAPTSRRFRHLHFQLHPPEWCAGFPTYWGNPPVLRYMNWTVPPDEWLLDRTLVATFIRAFPDALINLPPDVAQRTGCWMEGEAIHVGGWACPATWDAASRALTIARLDKTSEMDLQTDLIGDVGIAAAGQFMTWREDTDLPQPADILKEPRLISDVPTNRDDILFYVLRGCVELVRSTTKTALDNRQDRDAVRAAGARWLACWQVVGHVILGPLGGVRYQDALREVRAGRRRMTGPVDLGAVAGRTLSKQDTKPPEAPVLEAHEIDVLMPVLTAAGIETW